jgi:hypothetical protein
MFQGELGAKLPPPDVVHVEAVIGPVFVVTAVQFTRVVYAPEALCEVMVPVGADGWLAGFSDCVALTPAVYALTEPAAVAATVNVYARAVVVGWRKS